MLAVYLTSFEHLHLPASHLSCLFAMSSCKSKNSVTCFHVLVFLAHSVMFVTVAGSSNLPGVLSAICFAVLYFVHMVMFVLVVDSVRKVLAASRFFAAVWIVALVSV